jgi:hypothetical protein
MTFRNDCFSKRLPFEMTALRPESSRSLRHDGRRLRLPLPIAAACFLLWSLTLPAAAQTVPVQERIKAVTENMTPSGLALEAEILAWSDQDGRAAIVAALASKENLRSKLAEVPTKGYIWVAGSSVGYSIRYAHREMGADGHDRVTLLIDPALGAYTFEPWKIGDQSLSEGADYSFVELDLTDAAGYVSTPAGVVLDEEKALVAPKPDGGRQPVLAGVRIESTPGTPAAASGDAGHSAGGG